MSELRPLVVEQLVQAAVQGMLESGALDYSVDEVLSAYFTLMKRGILLTLKLSPTAATRDALRQSIMALLLDCADPTVN